jgi:hypothetical protein
MNKKDFIKEDPPGLDLTDVILTDPADIILPQDMEVLDPEDTAEELEVWRPGKAPISFLKCATCYLRKECVYYDAVSTVCAIKELENIDTSTGDAIIYIVQQAIKLQAERTFRFAKIEEMEGGFPDPSVTNEFMTLLSMIEKFKKILSDDDYLVIRARGKVSEGILDRLFKDIDK